MNGKNIKQLRLEEDDELDEIEDYGAQALAERRLATQPYDFAIKTLVDYIGDQTLDIGPKWQRREVWGPLLKSRLIESLIMNVPIPVIYLAEVEHSRYLVIDGQQRLRAIDQYIKDEFQLIGLNVRREHAGKRFSELSEDIQRFIKNRAIRCVVVLQETDPDLIFDIFTRLNSGVVQLMAQEMRNCIYHGPFNQLLIELAASEQWLNAIRMKEPDSRMKGEELILRYLAMSLIGIQDYSTPYREFLNQFMRVNRRAPPDQLNSYKERFLNTIQNVQEVFPDSAFRRWNPARTSFGRVLNKAVYDVVMLALEEKPHDMIVEHSATLCERFKGLFENDVFVEATVKSTADARKLTTRVGMYRTVVKEVCQL